MQLIADNYSERDGDGGTLSPSAYPSMTSREQAARAESVPNPRHCTKILIRRQGGVAGDRAPSPGTPHSEFVGAGTMICNEIKKAEDRH